MSRTTQFIGHTLAAATFLRACIKGEKIGEVMGMFQEHVCDLHEYKDAHGRVWNEFIQTEPWSSGPMIFLGIKTDGEFIGWEENIDIRPQEYLRDSGQFYV